MIITRKFNMDVLPGDVPLIIRASEKDNSSKLVLTLWSRDGVLKVPTTGVTVKIRGTTLGGTDCEETGTLTFQSGIPTVTVSLTRDMTSHIGMNPFELVLSGSGVKLCSATFYLDVR